MVEIDLDCRYARYARLPPTNSIGMITLFEERPWWRCTRHDKRLESELFVFCWTCADEDQAERRDAERKDRVWELREALRPLVKEVMEERWRFESISK